MFMKWVNPILHSLDRLHVSLLHQQTFPPLLTKAPPIPLLFRFSTLAASPPPLLVHISAAVDDRRLNDAWAFYERSLLLADDSEDDAPTRRSLPRKLLVALIETSDPHSLCRAFHAVESEIHRRHVTDRDSLLYLSLALAGNGMHVPASTALRRMTEIGNHPHVAVWTAVTARIVVASGTAGAFLAAELLLMFGSFFQDNNTLDKEEEEEEIDNSLLAMRPDPSAFEIVLMGCLASGLEKKAEELLDLMPRVGVNPSPDLLVTVAHVYERNARLDEIKKLENLAIGVDSSRIPELYDCLLSCQLKLNDLDSATGIVLDILKKRLAIPEPTTGANPIQNFHQPSFEEFCKDRDSSFRSLASETRELVLQMRRKLQARVELVKSDRGILRPSVRLYARLVRAFVEGGKTMELAWFLIKASEGEGHASLAAQAINACISLGMLEQSHDVIDEMRFHGFRVDSSVYSNLVEAYCREGKVGEATALLKEARRMGVQLDSGRDEALIRTLDRVSGKVRLPDQVTDLEGTTTLVEEMKDVEGVDHRVHEWNNTIHFFCKRRLMKDAQKALRKMRELRHTPNSATFRSLVTAYAAVGGKCVEVAEIWGEMKVLVRTSQLELDQQLLDSLLSCFIRVGLFLRANEVIKVMEEAGMFIDKYKYRALWLKHRRTFYRGKQAEAQVFKRWLGPAWRGR